MRIAAVAQSVRETNYSERALRSRKRRRIEVG